MRKTPITEEKHIKMANDMAAASHYLNKIAARIEKYYPKSSKASKAAATIDPNVSISVFSHLQRTLEAEWDKFTKKHKIDDNINIYSNLNNRYKDR